MSNACYGPFQLNLVPKVQSSVHLCPKSSHPYPKLHMNSVSGEDWNTDRNITNSEKYANPVSPRLILLRYQGM